MFKQTMWKASSTTLVACLVVSIWFSPHACWGGGDRTRILVNDIEISNSQWLNKRRLLEFERGLAAGAASGEPGSSDIVDEDATRECIEDILALELARRHKLNVRESDIDRKILQRRKLNSRLPPNENGSAWQALRARIRTELAMRQFANSHEAQYGHMFKNEEARQTWIAKRLEEERSDAVIEYR